MADVKRAVFGVKEESSEVYSNGCCHWLFDEMWVKGGTLNVQVFLLTKSRLYVKFCQYGINTNNSFLIIKCFYLFHSLFTSDVWNVIATCKKSGMVEITNSNCFHSLALETIWTGNHWTHRKPHADMGRTFETMGNPSSGSNWGVYGLVWQQCANTSTCIKEVIQVKQPSNVKAH